MKKLDKQYKQERKKLVKYLGIILGILIFLNLALLILEDTKKEGFSKILNYEDSDENDIDEVEKHVFFKQENSTYVEIKVPAINDEKEGVSTVLAVESSKGNGRTLVDIENILFWADTQQSIRMARYVAENITGRNSSKYNLIYNIKAKASAIGGPSAGSVIAIATIFALEGVEPRDDVMITGKINHDGSIGPASEILEKAKASKEVGASLFLVPLLQSRDVIYETQEHCQEFGSKEICSTETTPKKINVSNEADIEVIEVGSIKEAMGYFIPEDKTI